MLSRQVVVEVLVVVVLIDDEMSLDDEAVVLSVDGFWQQPGSKERIE